MRRIAGQAVLGIVLSLALWGAWAAAAPRTTTVPAHVRHAIAHDYPGMAWIPGRMPNGYRFARWTHSKKRGYLEYQLTFTKLSTSQVASQIYFQVVRRDCPSAPSWAPEGTFQINGHSVPWARSSTETDAWLCVRTQPAVLVGSNGPVRQDAVLVAYAHPTA